MTKNTLSRLEKLFLLFAHALWNETVKDDVVEIVMQAVVFFLTAHRPANDRNFFAEFRYCFVCGKGGGVLCDKLTSVPLAQFKSAEQPFAEAAHFCVVVHATKRAAYYFGRMLLEPAYDKRIE